MKKVILSSTLDLPPGIVIDSKEKLSLAWQKIMSKSISDEKLTFVFINYYPPASKLKRCPHDIIFVTSDLRKCKDRKGFIVEKQKASDDPIMEVRKILKGARDSKLHTGLLLTFSSENKLASWPRLSKIASLLYKGKEKWLKEALIRTMTGNPIDISWHRKFLRSR